MFFAPSGGGRERGTKRERERASVIPTTAKIQGDAATKQMSKKNEK